MIDVWKLLASNYNHAELCMGTEGEKKITINRNRSRLLRWIPVLFGFAGFWLNQRRDFTLAGLMWIVILGTLIYARLSIMGDQRLSLSINSRCWPEMFGNN